MRCVSAPGAAGKEDPKRGVPLKDSYARRLRGIAKILNEIRDLNPLAGGESELKRFVRFAEDDTGECAVFGRKVRKREREDSEGCKEGFHEEQLIGLEACACRCVVNQLAAHSREGRSLPSSSIPGLLHWESLMLSLGALRRIPITIMQTFTRSSVWLFLITFALVFYGMGAATVESFVNYPTWPLIGADEFRAYHRALSPLILGYMVVPLVVATLLTMLLLWFRPAAIPGWMIWLAIGLQLVAWVSTFTIQLPIQGQLSAEGLSLPLIDRLRVTSFWFRRVPNMANGVLFLWMMSILLRANIWRSAEA